MVGAHLHPPPMMAQLLHTSTERHELPFTDTAPSSLYITVSDVHLILLPSLSKKDPDHWARTP